MLWRLGIITTLLLLPLLYILGGSAQAAPSRQSAQPLDERSILFAINNKEHNPFDTEAAGASRLASLLARSGAEIDVVNWAAPIPADIDLVILAGAEANYRADWVARLWAYLDAGGSVLLMLEPPASERAVQENNPLFTLLWSDFGIKTTNSIAINPNQETLPPQLIAQVDTTNVDHPVLNDVQVENLVFDGLRPLRMQSFITNATATELLATDEQPYAESDVVLFVESGEYAYEAESDGDSGRHIAAIASENTETGARIVAIGDSTIITNEFGFGTSPPTSEAFIYADTVRFILNTVFWLIDVDTPEFSPPTPAPTATRTITPSPSPGAAVPIAPSGDSSQPQPTVEVPLPPIPATATPG